MTPDNTAQAMKKVKAYHTFAKAHHRHIENWDCPNTPTHDEYLEIVEENQKLHEDHARLVAGMEEISKYDVWSEHETLANIAKETLSQLHFPPS